MAIPVYVDPNQMRFEIKPGNVGKKLVVIINPDGFVVKQNGREIRSERSDFELTVPVTETGMMTIYYSPIFHLQQTIDGLVRKSQMSNNK